MLYLTSLQYPFLKAQLLCEILFLYGFFIWTLY